MKRKRKPLATPVPSEAPVASARSQGGRGPGEVVPELLDLGGQRRELALLRRELRRSLGGQRRELLLLRRELRRLVGDQGPELLHLACLLTCLACLVGS